MLDNISAIMSVLSPRGEMVDISKLRTFYPKGNWNVIRAELAQLSNDKKLVYSESKQGLLVGSAK